MSSTKEAGFFDSLVSTVRENPVAAALVGGGIVWLLVGGEKIKKAAGSATTAVATPVIDTASRGLRSAASALEATRAPPTAPEMDDEQSFQIGKTVREASSAGSNAISGAADRMKGSFDQGVAFMHENLDGLTNALPGRETFAKAQSSVAEMLEQQPLLIGAVGVAIGAAVAGALRTSDFENEWVGQLSDDVKTDLNRRAEAVSQSLRESSDTLKNELGDLGIEAADRVKRAGMDAADAARQKLTSRSEAVPRV